MTASLDDAARRARRAGACAGRPVGARRRRAGPQAGPAVRRARRRSSPPHVSWRRPAATEVAARELGGRGPVVRRRGPRAARPGRGARDPPRRAARAARPARRRRRDHGGQVGGGRRGVGPVRRRPGADVPALRRAPRLEDRDPRRHRLRPGRLQGRHAAHRARVPPTPTGCGPRSSSRAACTACSGCRSPSRRAGCTPLRPACSSTRTPAPRPPSRSTRRTCGSTSSARPGTVGRASTPPTPPCGSPTCPRGSSCPARTSVPSCRTARGPWRCCARGCRRWPRRRRRRKASADRRSQVRTVDRSERIRTYNYPENRISDHRIGYKAYNLSAVLDGDLGDLLDALAAAERAEAVAGA